jgi:hypothetical protein
MLMGHYRQSKRLTAMFLSSLLKVPCSTRWICKIQNTASYALEQPYQELQKQLEKQKPGTSRMSRKTGPKPLNAI